MKNKMIEVEHCLICKKYIGTGNDPAICDDESCKVMFEYELGFNRFARLEQAKELNQKANNYLSGGGCGARSVQHAAKLWDDIANGSRTKKV